MIHGPYNIRLVTMFDSLTVSSINFCCVLVVDSGWGTQIPDVWSWTTKFVMLTPNIFRIIIVSCSACV